MKATRFVHVASIIFAGIFIASCHDIGRFSTNDGDTYQGAVVDASFVRAGFGPGTRMCMTIDTDHLQDTPGAITTSDGRFRAAALRPIPQLWHDTLSTFSFGDGRVKNLLYVATANGEDAASGTDTMLVVSLMQTDQIEVRALRGAPDQTRTDGNLFAIFSLDRTKEPCFSAP